MSTSSRKIDWSGVINLAPDHIMNEPMTNRKPTVYFVNSMSDMFHVNMMDEWLVRLVRVMNDTPQHRYQIPTKRPSQMALKTRELGLTWSDNMWAGVSIEEDKYAKSRIRELLKVPAALRFVSAEPLLSALPSLDVSKVDWVIAGGESGVAKTVRRAELDWYRDLRDRCREAGVPFFFKQHGAHGEDGVRRSKKDNGSELDGEIIHEMPASVYDAVPDPRPSWTRGARAHPRLWTSTAEFRAEMVEEGIEKRDKRRIMIDGEPARIAIRPAILAYLARHGRSPVTNMRERILRELGIEMTAYAVNQHAWSLVDLQRFKLVTKVRGKVTQYELAARACG